ncbi:hypothetical protein [Clostridium hydrogeniformans]|uniref:hypothetical protein n=1 Tax=Clostridium hydrogeniformans TaxID=349933 RepID=UPI000485A307|nr:hypothetical protein [Clostridium hydrogeniformans]
MSDYRLDISGNLNLTDFSSIYDYISVVDYNDKFTISLNSVGDESVGLICEMLYKQNFIVKHLGLKEDGLYYITASKI